METMDAGCRIMKTQPLVSVILTTYNWPGALKKILHALANQSYRNFEVIVADDGSTHETAQQIETFKKQAAIKLKHVWQPDEGFQASKIRNKAVAIANGSYLIFLDGDCIPLPTFIERHVKLARHGWFVAGNRILLSEKFTKCLFDGELSIPKFNWSDWIRHRRLGNCNRISPLVYLPLFPRKLQPKNWKGAQSCNLGMWKTDFMQVNGFDEIYRGWGYEDSDLIIRLIKIGITKKQGRFAIPVIHLWHPQNHSSETIKNLEILLARQNDQVVQAASGVSQYLEGNYDGTNL
jgi:glycosyltransferase involved in cell wall biosynthesis